VAENSTRIDLGSATVDSYSLMTVGMTLRPQLPLQASGPRGGRAMSTGAIGLLYGAATLLVMFTGMPDAFALGAVATTFMISSCRWPGRYHHPERLRGDGIDQLLSIPLFILKGAAIGRSRAGRDLYGALHAWMHRFPGGLGIANVFACPVRGDGGIPARHLLGDRVAAGIPERCGDSPGFAAGFVAGGARRILLPPSITMILYAGR
jgi:TRAP-type mannitol/chloroaromatic compound transport system permease large subunit